MHYEDLKILVFIFSYIISYILLLVVVKIKEVYHFISIYQ